MKVDPTNLSKLVALGIFLCLGLYVAIGGYVPTLEPPPRETRPSFRTVLRPVGESKLGDLNIAMDPEEAFVVGDHLSTRVEVELSPNFGETARVCIIFPEGFSILKEMEWQNISKYEDWIIQRCNSTHPSTRQELTLRYSHEGVFGAKVVIEIDGAQPGSIKEFTYSDVVHIKPYTYLEERRNTGSVSCVAIGRLMQTCFVVHGSPLIGVRSILV